MIYCVLKGGLGNILFQIAAVKSLAIDSGVDCSFPNLIHHYGVMDADNYYIPNLKHSTEYHQIFDKLNVIQPTTSLPLTRYPFHYVKVDTPPDNFVVDGFFQSEKYFTHNREAILDYIKMPESVNKIITDKYSELLNVRTTAIHVRRGDYLKFPQHHPTQSAEYYLSAMDLVKNKTDKFLVFSDDIQWCKDNLNIDNIIYIEDEKDYIELYLMSLCDNNIISNSSFGWWGAWLNKNNDKVVVGPNKWFGPAIKHETSDIIPESWIKL